LNYLLVLNRLIIISILFFPLQNLGLSFFGSRYDITSFILLFLTLVVSMKNGKIEKNTIFFMFLFIYTQFLIFAINGTTPFYRTFSGMVWAGGLLLLILSRNRINYNPRRVYKTLLIVLFLTVALMLYQFIILGDARPKGTFDEPSKAALVLFSGAVSIAGIIYLYNLKIIHSLKMLIAFSIFFIGGLITLSMHIITFFIMVLIIIFLKPPFNLSSINNRQLFLFSIVTVSFFYLVNLLFNFSINSSESLLTKIDVFNSLNNNLSVLSWRTGFDQMIASINHSFIIGTGLGSTGFIDFQSNNLNKLLYLTPMGLNLNDAYSLSFRLIIEIGLLLFIMIFYFFTRKLYILKKYLSTTTLTKQYNESIPTTFIFLFSTSIIIGSLIKEPLYPASPLYLATMLFVSIKINYNSKSING
tara:strand:+ start:1097 stop:2341 length:1245 start_codon:yes stop_codon:yes gene_type:complete